MVSSRIPISNSMNPDQLYEEALRLDSLDTEGGHLKANVYYRKAAESGHIRSQYELGLRYYHGVWVPQSYDLAFKWLFSAAHLGDLDAQVILGNMYLYGQGVDQSYEEAVKWYRLAADQGNVAAQYNLGCMYYNGEGVEQSDEEAVKWYRLAADQGDDSAQHNLGRMYFNGRGVEQSYEEAFKWYRLAAVQGDADAQFYLGWMYEYGIGVEQSYEEAFKWYRLAAEWGVLNVQECVVRIQEGHDIIPSDSIPNDDHNNAPEVVVSTLCSNGESSSGKRNLSDPSIDWSKWHVDVSKLRKTSDDADFVYRMMYPEGLHDDAVEDTMKESEERIDENPDFLDEIGSQAIEYLRLCMVSSEEALNVVSDKGLDIDLFEDGINEIAYRHLGDTVVDHGCINEDMIETLGEILND